MSRRPTGWAAHRRPGLRVLLAVLAASALFAELWPWLWARWREEGGYFDHGPLVLPVALLWGWARLRTVAVRESGPVPPAMLLAVPAAGGLLLLTGRGVGFLGALGWWLAVGALVAAVAGGKGLGRLAGPWAFLLFMIPWPLKLVEDLSIPLKDSAIAWGLFLAPAGAVREGRSAVLTLPDGGGLLVGDVCSGLRGIIGALGVGYLLAGLLVRGPWRRGLVLAAGGFVAWAANALRITFLIAVGISRGSTATAAGGWAHDLSGIAAHILVLIAVTALAWSLGRRDVRRAADPPPAGDGRHALPSVGWALGVLLIIASGWLPRLASDAGRKPAPATVAGILPRELIPPASSGLVPIRGRDIPLEAGAAALLRPDECVSRVYGDPEWCHLMFVHGAGAEARIHAPEICFRGAGFEIVAATDLPVPDPFAEAPDRMNEVLAVRGAERRLVWYWFRSGRVSTGSYAGFAWRSLWRPGDPQVLVWLSCGLGPGGLGEGRERLRWSLRELANSLGNALIRL